MAMECVRKGNLDWGALAANVVEGAPEDMLLWEWAQLDVRKAARKLGLAEASVRNQVAKWSGVQGRWRGVKMGHKPVPQGDAQLLAVTPKGGGKREYGGVVRDFLEVPHR